MISMGVGTKADLLLLGKLIAIYGAAEIYPPGTHMIYSDCASNLGGCLTQNTKGVPFEQYVMANILRPLGMTSAGIAQTTPDGLHGRLIVGYEITELST